VAPNGSRTATWTLHETALSSYDPGDHDNDDFGYGPGIGLIDIDQDGLLDVALGRVPNGEDTGFCVYLNRSRPGEMRFEIAPDLCDGSIPAETIHIVDLNNNGLDELLLTSRGQLLWNEPASSDEFIDLYARLDDTDPRRDCLAGTSLVIDIDADGFLDVLLGCQLFFPQGPGIELESTAPNILLNGSADGPVWAYSNDEVAAAELDDPGLTLAFGAFIDESSGLWTIVDANDTFSFPDRRNTDYPPGRRLRMDSPDEWSEPSGLPEFESGPVVDGERNWGAFMGVSRLRTETDGVLTLLSDIGPILALKSGDRASDTWVDTADSIGLSLASLNGFQLFSWTMLVDDFDRDGRDDVFIVHGMFVDSNIRAHTSHRHVQAFQTIDGTFEPQYEGFGVTLPQERPLTRHAVPPSGRSVLRWDADMDGRMEIIINYHLGPPELYTLDEPADRCTVRPRARTVLAMNAGYAHDNGDGIWRSWDNGGQHRAAPPSTIMVPATTVRFRFPSGASVPISCSDGAYQELEEPDWLHRLPDTNEVFVDAELAGIDSIEEVRALWRSGTDSGIVSLVRDDSPSRWALPSLPDDAELMLELDGRWIMRWFP
jgi:hypothetical protein